MTDILTRLAAPFAASEVDWRLGTMKADKSKGMALAYIDARTVQDRLDAVCGPLWSCEHIASADKRMTCKIGIKIGDEWVWRSDGAGETDVEGEKGSYSDSFKRAAVRWGVGRYLYDLASPWVEVEPMGKSFKIAAHEKAKLDALVSKVARQAGPTSATSNVTRIQPAPAAKTDDLNSLIVMGNEAALRGSDTLKVWWTSRSAEERKSLGPDRIAAWKREAAKIDAVEASDPALRGAA